MIPIGYSRIRIGLALAVAVCIGAGVLIAMFLSSGATFSDIKLFGMIALVLALLCIVSDVASVCIPTTGEETLVTSEAYSRTVDSFVSDGFVDVYYSSRGEYWIELSK